MKLSLHWYAFKMEWTRRKPLQVRRLLASLRWRMAWLLLTKYQREMFADILWNEWDSEHRRRVTERTYAVYTDTGEVYEHYLAMRYGKLFYKP